MEEIIVIGTLHSNKTSHEELVNLLNDIQPDKVFVELSPEELSEKPRQGSIRDEMFAAYDWAHNNEIPVYAFDIENDILKEGVTGSEQGLKEYENEMKKTLKDYSWKQLNKAEPWNIPRIREIEDKLEETYIDREKSKKREQQILKNIKQELVEGKNVVLTGVGHLSFLEKELPNARFIFRNEENI